MNSIITLEELIKENEERANLQRRQLAAHESGINKLSRLSKASAEVNLDKALEFIDKYKAMLEELLKEDIEELEEKERIEAAIKRKKYFENQHIRIKSNREIRSDQRLEAMLIIDELPSDINFEDEELLEIAVKSVDLNITNHKELHDKLATIRKEFKDLLRDAKNEKLSELGMLKFQIPILVLQFCVLAENIGESLAKKELAEKKAKEKEKTSNEIQTDENEEEKLSPENQTEQEEEISEEDQAELEKIVSKFKGFPKYEDWWISEMWSSHQAYFALYKWKDIISNLCITDKQKRAWSTIFDNWIFIKKMINSKGQLAYDYTFAFDMLIKTHSNLDEEESFKNLASMEKIIMGITKKEDFGTVSKNHKIITPYLSYKKAKLKQ